MLSSNPGAGRCQRITQTIFQTRCRHLAGTLTLPTRHQAGPDPAATESLHGRPRPRQACTTCAKNEPELQCLFAAARHRIVCLHSRRQLKVAQKSHLAKWNSRNLMQEIKFQLLLSVKIYGNTGIHDNHLAINTI
ncbi:MAG: hypothetical protein ACXIVD_10880 [Salinarimonas sp.]